MNDFQFCIQSFVLEMWLVLRMHVLYNFTWGAIQVQKNSTCLSVGPARKVLFLSMNNSLLTKLACSVKITGFEPSSSWCFYRPRLRLGP